MSRITGLCLAAVLFILPTARTAPLPDGALIFRGRSLSQWVDSLSDRDLATRTTAAGVIAVIGPQARSAVPALRSLLKDEDAAARHRAIQALGEIGPTAAGTAAGLREALAHQDADDRHAAVDAAHSWGEGGIPLLIEALNDSDQKVRAFAAGCLTFRTVRLPKEAITGLARALADPEDEVRRAAVDALWVAGPAAKNALPALRKATGDSDHEVRVQAAEVLARVGELRAAVNALTAMVADDDGTGFAQTKSALALASIGPKAKDALPMLEAALKSRHTMVRLTAASALRQIDRREKSIVPVLVAEVEAPTDIFADAFAGLELASMGAAGVPPLEKLLRSPREMARRTAAGALGEIGPEATAALGDLTGAMKDVAPEVRRAAIAALLRIGPDDVALAALTGALRDKQPQVRRDAAFALLHLGHAADKSVPVFEELLKEKEDDDTDDRLDRVRAARALWKITRRTGTAVTALVKELESDDALAMQAAAGVLAEMGRGAREAIPALTAALTHKYDYVRCSALLALAAAGDPPKEVLPIAVAALEGDDYEQRVSGAVCLAALGRRAESALPVLTGRLRDKHPLVRRAAALALKRIAPGRDVEVPPLKVDEPIAAGMPVEDWLRRMRSPFMPLRERDAMIVQLLGPEPVVLKGLVECLSEPDPKVRDRAAACFCLFGRAAKDAAPLLLPLLKHKHAGVRHAAAEALRAIDPEKAARMRVN